MRQLFAGLACFGIAAGLLVWQYPWAIYHDRFLFTAGETIGSYICAASLMTAVCMLTAYAVLRSLATTKRVAWAVASACSIVLLWVVALLLGPGGLNFPGTRLRGMFFAEWQFVLFMVLVPVFSFAASAVLVWAAPVRRSCRVLNTT